MTPYHTIFISVLASAVMRFARFLFLARSSLPWRALTFDRTRRRICRQEGFERHIVDRSLGVLCRIRGKIRGPPDFFYFGHFIFVTPRVRTKNPHLDKSFRPNEGSILTSNS